MALVGQELNYKYSRHSPLAIENVSVEINLGESLIIAGLNGSGKSTLLKMLAGIYLPSAGQIWLDGSKSRHSGHPLPGVGLVMANPERYFFAATVEEEIAFGLKGRGLKPHAEREQVVNALEAVNLGAEYLKRNPLFLSLGEQRKVGIAAILVLQPRYLLLDEPFSNLDPEGVSALSAYLEAYVVSGHTAIVTSHRASEVMWCQRLLVIHQGHLVYDGRLDDWQITPQFPLMLTEAAYLRYGLAERGITIDHLASPQEIANQIVLVTTGGLDR